MSKHYAGNIRSGIGDEHAARMEVTPQGMQAYMKAVIAMKSFQPKLVLSPVLLSAAKRP